MPLQGMPQAGGLGLWHIGHRAARGVSPDPGHAEILVTCDPRWPHPGLQFGRRRIHQGQGTANACAFFDNAYLELLWRHDDDELQSEVVRPLGLWERVRWRETGASPFGVAFRPEDDNVPIETWPYDAPFLPEGID